MYPLPVAGAAAHESLPESIRLIDPALGVASQLDALLGTPIPGGLDQPLSLTETRICVTADADGCRPYHPLAGATAEVELVDLQ